MKSPVTDAHVWLGRWPYGPLAASSAKEILAKMDELGIERAVVSAPQALLYKDVHRSNAELVAEAAPAGGRFLLAATLNPAEPGWEKDLEEARAWGMRALNLHPNYHGYDVVGAAALEIAQAAAAVEWPVIITARMQDERQQHRLGRVPPVPIAAIARGLNFFEIQQFLRLARAVPDWWISIERAHVPQGVVPMLIAEAGVERLVFASMYPFQYAESTWLKVSGATDLTPEQQETILAGNAARIFPAVPWRGPQRDNS
jgi:predicted TIM-barrel fold metal-dependent hydrolase